MTTLYVPVDPLKSINETHDPEWTAILNKGECKMSETLHRKEAAIDQAEPKGTLTHCQWCGVPLDPTDKVWECAARLDHYLVCDGCHEEAIIH